MCNALKRGRKTEGNYYFIERTEGLIEQDKPAQTAKITEKQFQNCITKLRKVGITNEELALLNSLNARV
jgi:hypothetical protein